MVGDVNGAILVESCFHLACNKIFVFLLIRECIGVSILKYITTMVFVMDKSK